MFGSIARWLVIIVLFVLVPGSGETALADARSDFHRGYFLEHSARDFPAAKAAYERAGESAEDAGLRRSAQAGAARCRDQIAAEDLTTLLPPDAIGYVCVHRPGELIASLARMLGLAGRPMGEVLDERPDSETSLPFTLPEHVNISPALLQVLSGFGGAAAAITDVRDGDELSGVLVVHYGDAALMRGVVETAFQFSPTAKKIGGLPTFRAEEHAVGVLTETLLIVGTTRSLVEDVVGRLEGRVKESLASRDDLGDALAGRKNSTLFLFADGQRGLDIIKRHLPDDPQAKEEFARADALVDFKSLRWAALSFGARDEGLALDLNLRLADGHRNLAYNLVRLPSMSRRSLAFVPAEAAAVVGLSLNPPRGSAPADRSGGAAPPISALDLGRELFGNIEEIAAFVVPPEGGVLKGGAGNGGPPIPDIGIVIAAGDVTKSAALWDQILGLASMADSGRLKAAQPVKIAGVEGRRYDLPDGMRLWVADHDGCLIAGTSSHAVKSAIFARKREKSVLTDAAMGKLLAKSPADTCILVAAHGGRCAGVAAGHAPLEERMPLNMAASAMKDTALTVNIAQGPSEFSVRVGVGGLPNVNELIQKFAPMFGGGGHRPHAENSDRAEGEPPAPESARQ